MKGAEHRNIDLGQKKSPEENQQSSGEGVSVRRTYCSEERDGKHKECSEERPLKKGNARLPEFLKLLRSEHIPMLILPKLKPMLN